MINAMNGAIHLTFINGYSVSITMDRPESRFVQAETYIPSGSRSDAGHYSADDLADLLKRVSSIDGWIPEELAELRSTTSKGD